MADIARGGGSERDTRQCVCGGGGGGEAGSGDIGRQQVYSEKVIADSGAANDACGGGGAGCDGTHAGGGLEGVDGVSGSGEDGNEGDRRRSNRHD